MIADSRDEDDEDSFDRPELPRELPFEQGLAAIPPEAMRALQEEFLAGLYEPEDEGKVSHADMVAEATQRTREFLLACHDEKWRRQKSSHLLRGDCENAPCGYCAENTELHV